MMGRLEVVMRYKWVERRVYSTVRIVIVPGVASRRLFEPACTQDIRLAIRSTLYAYCPTCRWPSKFPNADNSCQRSPVYVWLLADGQPHDAGERALIYSDVHPVQEKQTAFIVIVARILCLGCMEWPRFTYCCGLHITANPPRQQARL